MELGLVVTEADPELEGGQLGGLLLGGLVVAPQELGHLLVVVEDDVRVGVPAGHCVGPELLHEEDLVGQDGHGA